MAVDPSIDMNAETGADITGWPHVVQCVQVIFATHFAERVMREWFGSVVPRFLGENLNEQTVVPFFSAIASAIEVWEPRFRVTKIVPEHVGRDGNLSIIMEGHYRPRALLGDFTVVGSRRLLIAGSVGAGVEVING